MSISCAQPGDKFGDYTIIRELGRGGMGVVYLAQHEYLKKRFAIKVLPEEYSESPEFVAIFQQEAQTLGTLKHPNIVEVHNFGVLDNAYYLVMDFIDGQTIEDYLAASGGKMQPEEVQATLLSVMSGITHAHGKGIIHRDLKPENFLVDSEGTVKISDFGLAQLMTSEIADEEPDRNTKNTFMHLAEDQAMAGQFTGGTEGYMAPEVEDGGMGDKRADYYAIGVIAYYLLTGKEPGKRIEKVSKTVKGIDPRWDKMIDKCLQEDPDDRYQDALDLLVEIERIKPKSRPHWHWISASAVTILSLCLGWYIFTGSEEEIPEHSAAPEIQAVLESEETNPVSNKTESSLAVTTKTTENKENIGKQSDLDSLEIQDIDNTDSELDVISANIPEAEEYSLEKKSTDLKLDTITSGDRLLIQKESKYNQYEPFLLSGKWQNSNEMFGRDPLMSGIGNYKFFNPENWIIENENGSDILTISERSKPYLGDRPGNIAIFNGTAYGNFEFEVNFRSNEVNTTAIDDADIVILFGYKDEGNFLVLELNSYSFEDKALTSIYRIRDGEKLDLDIQSDKRGIQDQDWHKLTLKRFVESIQVFIDDELFLSASHPALITDGLLGLGSYDNLASFYDPIMQEIQTSQVMLTLIDPDGNEISTDNYKLFINGQHTLPVTGTSSYHLPANQMVVGIAKIDGYEPIEVIKTVNPIPPNKKSSYTREIKDHEWKISAPEEYNANNNVTNPNLNGNITIRSSSYLVDYFVTPLSDQMIEAGLNVVIRSNIKESNRQRFENLGIDEMALASLNNRELELLEQAGFEVKPVAKMASIFVVNANHEIENLTEEDLQRILFKQERSNLATSVFPSEIYRVIPSKRNERESGSITFLDSADELFRKIRTNRNGLGIVQSGVNLGKPGIKTLTINYSLPEDSDYPYVVNLFAVTQNPSLETRNFIDFMTSESGSSVIKKTGFTPIK